MSRYHQGKFQPKHPEKYKGDPTNIIYRSSWELKLLMYLDNHPNILQYSSEEVVIPYLSPIDGRWHRYFVDFYVKKLTPGGKIEEVLIEVKPESQMVEPKPRNTKNGKPSRQYIKEVYRWGVNSAKWAAAESYCAARGWTFVKMGAKDLGIKF